MALILSAQREEGGERLGNARVAMEGFTGRLGGVAFSVPVPPPKSLSWLPGPQPLFLPHLNSWLRGHLRNQILSLGCALLLEKELECLSLS